ncbi:helix-turn-helix domain-containing protein [Micromonospora sp. PTRAS2]
MLTPSRLVVARRRRRMTLANLAAVSGVSARSITAFENGHKQPSPDTLGSLSEALDFPVDFFSQPAIDEIPLPAVSFRALSKMTALDRDAALAAGQISMIINAWIEANFRLPEMRVPSLAGVDPEHAANRVRGLWGLGEQPIANMVHLLEANGVRVFSLASDCISVDAFSLFCRGTPFVFLNTTKSGERGRFDAAHELGHLLLHGGDRTAYGPDAEDEANRFASALLMPRSSILSQLPLGATPDQILVAKRRWKVSAFALAYRLHELGLLSDWKYKVAAQRLSQLGYRKNETGGISRETSQLLAKVFAALRQENLQNNKGRVSLADEVYLHTTELNRHVFGLVPIALEGGGQATPARPVLQLVGGRRR